MKTRELLVVACAAAFLAGGIGYAAGDSKGGHTQEDRDKVLNEFADLMLGDGTENRINHLVLGWTGRTIPAGFQRCEEDLIQDGSYLRSATLGQWDDENNRPARTGYEEWNLYDTGKTHGRFHLADNAPGGGKLRMLDPPATHIQFLCLGH